LTGWGQLLTTSSSNIRLIIPPSWCVGLWCICTFQRAGGNANHCSTFRDIANNGGSRACYSIGADADVWTHDGTDTNKGAIAERHVAG
jgi:hypothetical protein